MVLHLGGFGVRLTTSHCKRNGVQKRRTGPRRRWEHNIRMDLEEIGINVGNWVDSAQDRDYWIALVNAA